LVVTWRLTYTSVEHPPGEALTRPAASRQEGKRGKGGPAGWRTPQGFLGGNKNSKLEVNAGEGKEEKDQKSGKVKVKVKETRYVNESQT